jgi:hypothetical protein
MLHFYHPNKRITGSAASFWYSDRDDTIFGTILKQSGWDEQKNNGLFKANKDDPNKRVNIKLSYVEVGAILDCIERNRPFTSYHDHDLTPKSINFIPWMMGEKPNGYSFSVTVSNKQDSSVKNSFVIGFTFAEARLIREFLIFILHRHFNKTLLNKPQTDYNTSTETVKEGQINPQESLSNNEESKQQVDPLLDF